MATVHLPVLTSAASRKQLGRAAGTRLTAAASRGPLRDRGAERAPPTLHPNASHIVCDLGEAKKSKSLVQ